MFGASPEQFVSRAVREVSACSDPASIFSESFKGDARARASVHECTLHSVPGRRPRERRAAFHRRFQKVGMVNHLAIVPNGEDSIEYLKGTGVYSNRIYYPFPGLLITDLKMSKRTGFDFLA